MFLHLWFTIQSALLVICSWLQELTDKTALVAFARLSFKPSARIVLIQPSKGLHKTSHNRLAWSPVYPSKPTRLMAGWRGNAPSRGLAVAVSHRRRRRERAGICARQPRQRWHGVRTCRSVSSQRFRRCI